MASAEWTDWQQAGNLDITDPSSAPFTGGGIFTPFKYRDAWTVGAGADYFPIPRIKLMGGVGYDETPVLTQYRNDLLPDNNRVMVAGAAIDQTRQSLGPTGLTPTQAGTLTGQYTLSADVFSTGFILKF